MGVVRWLHLVGAAVWVGGLVTLAALVPALRDAGVGRPALQALARQFARVSWTAMAIAVPSGAWIAYDLGFLDRPELAVKVGLVVLAAGLAAWHQLAAGRQSPALRGMLQASILVVSLAIFAASVAL